MRVTEKGQVTIPKHIREKLGIVPGSEVEFAEHSDGQITVAVRATSLTENDSFESVLRNLSGTVDLHGTSVDEYLRSTRGERDDLDRH
ncbi:MAG: AbrB/MazE/SpoVT family DNA-binding domain-containing protein [Pseudomonadota bacterium]